MSSMEEKIRLLAKKTDTQELQEYLDTLETAELTQIVSRRIHNQSFTTLFDYLLQGFSDSSQAHDKRFRTVSAVLEQSQVPTVSSVQLKNLVCRLCAELHKFKTEHLVAMCGICLEYILKGNMIGQSWNDLLPVLLQIIEEREEVDHHGETITGIEYKTQLIASMLIMDWSPNIITPLTNMFITMPLTKVEHAQVVNKLGQYMEKLMPQEMPAFIYQLLKLCKSQNSRSVFLRLQNYFGLRVYSNNPIANENQNSESMDIIGNASDMDAIQAESTVLFHINESATKGNTNIHDYLNSLRSLTKSPEFILHPFQLTVVLSISTVSFFEERAMEILKAAVFRAYSEEQKKSYSCWFREMVPNHDKISNVFMQVINLSVQDRILVLQGLINFGFMLLGTSTAFGKEAIQEKMWHLGNLIILKLIKRKRNMARIIVKRLVNDIITEQNVGQYIECLHCLSKRYGLVLLENQSCVIELMERMTRVSKQASDEILDAIIPLTKISFTLRDHLTLLLQKALFSRMVSIRQMAVSGFLKLIKILKFSNLGALSQSSSSSFSGSSVITQVALSATGQNNSTFTNEALCLQVLTILQRVFTQQAEVKYKLYEGFYDAVCMNPDLGVPILELMWSHFSQYYDSAEDSTVPINFSKLFQVKEMDVILMEPMGKLLYSIGLIVRKYLEVGDTNGSVVTFVNAFAKLSEKMAECDLEHFQLNDGTDLLDVLPESQEKMLLLKEAISVYEALIGFNICSWNETSDNIANTVLQLHKGYNRLLQFGKNLLKPKKDDKGKTTRTSQTLNDTSRKDGSGKRTFKPYPTVLDFQALDKLLCLLYRTSVSWTTIEEANIVRRNVEINHYAMQTTINLLQQAKQQKNMTEEKKSACYKYCKSISVLLFDRCISRFKDFSNFDTTTAVLSVDAFYMLLQLINAKYKDKWCSFLSYTTSESRDEVHLQECLDVYKALFETLDDDTPQDAETTRFFQTVVNSLAVLAEQIPTQSNPLSSPLIDWMKQFAMNKQIKGKQLSMLFVALLFNLHTRFKSTMTPFRNVALKLNEVLGSVSGKEVEGFEDVSIITDSNKNNILVCLCNEIKSMLDDIDWIILRLRSEFLMITYPGEESIERRRECLKSKERSICCQICQVIGIMTIVVDIKVTPGTYLETIIKNIIHLYNTLTNLTKYFFTRSNKVNVAFQQARFESVVKQAGKKLSPAVYILIPFIELKQKEDSDALTQHSKKKAAADANKQKTKVLKETRLIPKLIYEMEQFSISVIQLSNKTKVDVARYVGQGTSRDFRILEPEFRAALQEGDHDDDDDSILERETVIAEESNASDSDESEEPIAKKTKK